MFCKKILTFVLLLAPLALSAQKTMKVSVDYTYYAQTNISVDQAKAMALEEAKIDIIAKEFGTVVGVNNTSVVTSDSEYLLSLGESEVKGEWIRTIGEPVFSVEYRDNLQIVNVRVKGEIRELKNARIQLDSKVLRNGVDDRFESGEFRSGDDLFISFSTPIDGYLAIFLYDQSGVCRLLPLKNDRDGSVFVESGRRQVFFERHSRVYSDETKRYSDRLYSEYVMTCSREAEMNRIYVVFSPNRFVRPVDNVDAEKNTMPANLSFEDFQKWLAKSRKQDVDMTVDITDIIVRQ